MNNENQSELALRTRRKIAWRLLPMIALCAFFAFLDRVNIGFAAVEMQADLGLSATAYGLGAGIFFISYTLLEVPGNLLMLRVGPGAWIARIMATWGLISAATAFIPQIAHLTGFGYEAVFYGLRFLLGVAEASFAPCVIYYIGIWFPSDMRARALAAFSAIVPLAALIGSPVSGVLLYLEGMGLAGWQWMFLVEAIPAIALAPLAYWRLTNTPAKANWLTAQEKEALVRALQAGDVATQMEHQPVLKIISDRRVLSLGFTLFCILCAFYAILFFLPQVISDFGTTNRDTGLIGAIPYLASVIAMLAWGYHSDRTQERKWHFVASAVLLSLALVMTALSESLWFKVLFLTLGAMGAFSCMPVFYAMAQQFLKGRAAAAGLAAINSLGNTGGFVSPILMGAIKDSTGTFNLAFYLMALFPLFAAWLILRPFLRQPETPKRLAVNAGA